MSNKHCLTPEWRTTVYSAAAMIPVKEGFTDKYFGMTDTLLHFYAIPPCSLKTEGEQCHYLTARAIQSSFERKWLVEPLKQPRLKMSLYWEKQNFCNLTSSKLLWYSQLKCLKFLKWSLNQLVALFKIACDIIIHTQASKQAHEIMYNKLDISCICDIHAK